jgi:hypothetical protein
MHLQVNEWSQNGHANGMRKTAPQSWPSLANNHTLIFLRSLATFWPANLILLPSSDLPPSSWVASTLKTLQNLNRSFSQLMAL